MTDIIKAEEIHIRSGHTPGYGGPDSWWVLAHWQNVKLDEAKCWSERDAGKAEARIETIWKRDWDRDAFLAEIKDRPQASPPCSNCQQHTLDGCSSQYERYWCKRPPCKLAQEAYAVEKRAEHARREQAEADRRDAEHADLLKRHADAQTGFHWREGWYFKRMPDGSVRVSHVTGSPFIHAQFAVPAPEWASIVCSVSAAGETGERWNASQDFHGRAALGEHLE
jgi:hypothetical protein